MKEVAIFGGTFDPPTYAHEAIARACLGESSINETWWMPSGSRVDKPNMLSDQARLNMLRLIKDQVFKQDRRLIITDFEQNLPKPTQTYQTAQALRRAYPDHHFWFVFGADSYQDMSNWSHGLELRQEIGMLIVPRLGIEMPAESDNLKHLYIEESYGEVSSTEARMAVTAGRVGGLVSACIDEYIKQQHFYETAVVGRI